MISQLAIIGKVGLLLLAAGLAFALLLRREEAQWVKTRAMPITVGFWVFAMLVPSPWFIYVAIVMVIPLASRTRADAPAIYLVTMLALPTVGREFGFAGMYLLPLERFLFGALGLGLTALVKPHRRPPIGKSFDLPFWLVMIVEVTMARGANPVGMLRIETNVLLSYILPYLVVRRSWSRPEDMRLTLLAFIYGGFVSSAVALLEHRMNWLAYASISDHLGITAGVSAYTHIRSGHLRAGASFTEATSLGLFLAMTFLATIAGRDFFRNRARWLMSLGAILVGLYAANARASILAVIIGVICYDIYRKRFSHAAVKVAVIGMLYLMAMMAAQFSDGLAERLGIRGDSVGTADYRSKLAIRSWEEIRTRPLFGVGPTNVQAAVADLRQGEGIIDFVNAYAYYALAAGLVGVFLLLLCFDSAMLHLVRIRALLRGDLMLTRIGAFAFSVVAFTIVTTYTSGFGSRTAMFFYTILAMASALGPLRRNGMKMAAIASANLADTSRIEPDPSDVGFRRAEHA